MAKLAGEVDELEPLVGPLLDQELGVGDIGGEPAAFMAIDSRELYVALHDGTIKVSRDAGET